MAKYQYGVGTDVGLSREHNEDSFLVNDDIGLWVVADGMGGHEAGEVASAIAVSTVNSAVMRGEPLERAHDIGHQAILRAGKGDGPGSAGMGCTCIAVTLKGADFKLAWVGDSRAYLWDGKKLSQISHDHSYVQSLIDLGVITPEEALVHPDRSVLTQCLGSRSVEKIEVGSKAGKLLKGQSILLCSDGLTGEVTDQGIAEVFADSSDAQAIVDRLIIAALEGGGSDNVTVIVISGTAAS